MTGGEVQLDPLDGNPALIGIIAFVILDVHTLRCGFIRVEGIHVQRQVKSVSVAQCCTLVPKILDAQVVLPDRGFCEILFEECGFNVDLTGFSSGKNCSRNGDGILIELGIVQLNIVPLDVWFFIPESFWNDDEVHSVLL